MLPGVARTCTICRHPNRHDIDAGLATGTPYRDIAGRFAVSTSALDRHRGHVAHQLAEVETARRAVSAQAVADLLAEVVAGLRQDIDDAEKVQDRTAARLALLKVAQTMTGILGPALADEFGDPALAAAKRARARVDAAHLRESTKILAAVLPDEFKEAIA
jgi:hypothetical protein